MHDISAVRNQILAAFADVAMPSPGQMAAQQEHHFNEYTAQDYQYDLPEHLVGIIDQYQDSKGESAIYLPGAIEPDPPDVYYKGSDAYLEALITILSREQVLAVAAFLGLVLTLGRSFEFIRAARAMRLCWNREGGPDAAAFAEFDWQMRHFEYPTSSDPIVAALVDEIRVAFADTPYPGDNRLSSTFLGLESSAYALELRGVDWRTAHPALIVHLNASPELLTFVGYRYFLPAFMIINLMKMNGEKDEIDITFHLTFYFTKNAAQSGYWKKKKNPFAYGAKAMAHYSRTERKAIIHYLEYRAEHDRYVAPRIYEALEKYWRPSVNGGFDLGGLGDAT